MADHPTTDTIESYARGTLPAELLLDVDAHLASCPDCRRQLGSNDPKHAATPWRMALDTAGPSEHPSYEQFEAYVDNRIDPYEREILDAHIVTCTSCAAELGDLRSFKAALSTAEPPHAGVRGVFGLDAIVRLIRGPEFALAATVIVVVGLGSWMLVARNRSPQAETVAERPAPPTVAPPSAVVARLQDANAEIVIAADGTVTGLPPMPDAEQTVVLRAVKDGRLPAPAGIADVFTTGGTLLGARGSTTALAIVGPIATAVESDRPEFTWTALPGATEYDVAIYDDQFTLVLESSPVRGTSWQPAKPLTRGRTYSWQVRAMTPGGAMTAPKPPAREARFAVISAADAKRIADVRVSAPVSRVRLAVAYAQAGLLDAAEDELEVLRQLNPSSPTITALLDNLRDIRR